VIGVELNPGHVENVMQGLCSDCDSNLKSGIRVNHVDDGITTAVKILIFKSRRVEKETATDDDLRDSGFWKRN
jgi:hypothetical protein